MGLFFKTVKVVKKKKNTKNMRDIPYVPRTWEEAMGNKPHKRII